MYWYIVTPWRKKYLGTKLPEAVIRRARFVSHPPWGGEPVFYMKSAIVTNGPPPDREHFGLKTYHPDRV